MESFGAGVSQTCLGENFFGQGLSDLVDVGLDTSFLQASLLSFSKLSDVAVQGVLLLMVSSAIWSRFSKSW